LEMRYEGKKSILEDLRGLHLPRVQSGNLKGRQGVQRESGERTKG